MYEIVEAGDKRRKDIEEKRMELRGKRGGDKLEKKGKKRGLRFALATLGEVIPFLGALPFWTIFVYLELKNS